MNPSNGKTYVNRKRVAWLCVGECCSRFAITDGHRTVVDSLTDENLVREVLNSKATRLRLANGITKTRWRMARRHYRDSTKRVRSSRPADDHLSAIGEGGKCWVCNDEDCPLFAVLRGLALDLKIVMETMPPHARASAARQETQQIYENVKRVAWLCVGVSEFAITDGHKTVTGSPTDGNLVREVQKMKVTRLRLVDQATETRWKMIRSRDPTMKRIRRDKHRDCDLTDHGTCETCRRKDCPLFKALRAAAIDLRISLEKMPHSESFVYS